MTLHIGLDCFNNDLNNKLIGELTEFLKNKSYNVAKRVDPCNPSIIDILNNYALTTHEIMLLKAFDRSFSYYGENWGKYEICLWEGTILQDYHLTSNSVPKLYVKQINKYFPKLDLYITVVDGDIGSVPVIDKNKHKIIKYNEENTLNDIINVIFDNLPRCNWCGKLFTKSTKNKKYCSTKCKNYGLEEQYRDNSRKYYHRYKDVMSERSKGQLGSKGANLHETADPNPFIELEKIRRAKKALGLKPIR